MLWKSFPTQGSHDRVVNRGRSSYERRINICPRRGSKKRGSISTLQYASRRT